MKNSICRTALLAFACLSVFVIAAPPLSTPSKANLPPPLPPTHEDCLPFNPNNLMANHSGSDYVVMDGGSRMFYFATAAQATEAIAKIRMHGFKRQCFIGRPFSAGRGMSYFLP